MSSELQEAAGESQAATAGPCPTPIEKQEDPRFALQKNFILSLTMAGMWQGDALKAMTPDDIAALSKELRTLYRDLTTLTDIVREMVLPPEWREDYRQSHGAVWYEAYKAWKQMDEIRQARAN